MEKKPLEERTLCGSRSSNGLSNSHYFIKLLLPDSKKRLLSKSKRDSDVIAPMQLHSLNNSAEEKAFLLAKKSRHEILKIDLIKVGKMNSRTYQKSSI